jgi:hypothetical protein
MSTKPTKVPLWNTGATNRVEPSAGKKILGWLLNERPPAQYLNWLLGYLGDWAQYLSDGALSGAFTFASTVEITGLITALAGLTAAANQHITVSGTGRFKHGDMIKAISPYCFVANASANWTIGLDAGYLLSTSGGTIVVPIPMVVGERIKSMTYARYGTATSDFTSIQVLRLAANGTLTDLTAAATTDLNIGAAWADKVVDITDTTCTDGDVFWARWVGNETDTRLGSIRVTYDRP